MSNLIHKMWVAVLCAALALSATANAGRDIATASRALLQTAGIESVANAVAQQPAVPQMVSTRHDLQSRASLDHCCDLPLSQPWCSPA